LNRNWNVVHRNPLLSLAKQPVRHGKGNRFANYVPAKQPFRAASLAQDRIEII